MVPVAGALAPWLALTGVFVLAVGWVLLASRAAKERGPALRLAVASALLWAASGLAAYLAVYRTTGRNQYMRRFWELAFVRPDRPGFLHHTWKTVEDLVWGFVAGDPQIDRRPFVWMLHVGSVVVLALCALGILRLARARGWAAGAWLWAPRSRPSLARRSASFRLRRV